MKYLDATGRILKGLAATILLALAAPVAQAQCAFEVTATPAGPLTLCAGGSTTLTAAALTSSFNAGGSGFNAVVRAVRVQPDGKVLVGGEFTEYNRVNCPDYLVRLNADGSLDPGFNGTSAGLNGAVHALALEPDGQVLAGGAFTAHGGASLPGGLVRFNVDGSRDLAFGTGAGFTGTVRALALEPDGQVLAGGNFAASGGGSGPGNLVRLHADGLRDATFNGSGSGFQFGSVRALALEPDGQVLVGGDFLQYNGLDVPDRMVRLNANGSVDTSFNPGGSGFSSSVYALALEPDGQILAGGDFTTYNGAGPAFVQRLNADGSRDVSFNAGGTGFGYPGNQPIVLALVLEPDGQILAGGDFLEYNGANVPDRLVRLNANGSRDAGFNGANAGFNGLVRALALEPDGQVLAGGDFGGYNNLNGPACLTRLNPDGSRGNEAFTPPGVTYAWSNGATGPTLNVSTPGLYQATATSGGCVAYSNVVRVDATPAVTVQVTPVGPISLPAGSSQVLTAAATLPAFASGGAGFNSSVNAIVVQPDGKIVVGGSFTTYNGINVPDCLMRLNPDGNVDTSFNAGGAGLSAVVLVEALVLLPGGQLLVGGEFNLYNGLDVPDKLIRLNPDGTLDGSFNAGGSGFDATVQTLAVQPDGRVLVGGGFNTYNGAPVPRGLVRLLPGGGLDASFNGGGAGFAIRNVVEAIALEADGQVVVGGNFASYNGNAAVPDNLLRINADGSWDAAYNAGGIGVDDRVITLLILPDGKALAGGAFEQFNAQPFASGLRYLARFNADGQPDATFNAGGTGPGGAIVSLARTPDGRLLITGGTVSYNGMAAAPSGVARIDADGTLDTSFNGGGAGFSSGSIRTVAVQADGQVLVGGYSTTRFNGSPIPRGLARLNGSDGLLNNAPTPLPGATFVFNPGATAGNPRTITTSGAYTATVTDPRSGCSFVSNTVQVTIALPDLVVSTPGQVVPAGAYNNITVTGTGVGTLQGNVRVEGALVVEAGGQLLSGCFLIEGPGSFTLAAGATLGICDAGGISVLGPNQLTGMVRVTGPRTYSDDATYLYNGTAAQATGDGLPATVRGLTVDNPAGVGLSRGTAVRRQVTLAGAGDLRLFFNVLLLLSDANGTALIANLGTGRVLGPTGSMQRHIETNTAANGYRHYSSPVQDETLGTGLTATSGGYRPDFSGAAAYNSSPTPGTVTPFPTVFAYNQDRIASTVSSYNAFDKGWQAPTSGSAPMTVGQGYAVQAPGTALVDFTGTFTSGAVTRSGLARTGPDGGWHLLGNPYPSPLDWRTLTLGAGQNLENLDGAVYVFQSSGSYAGSYRTYQNGLGNPLIPAGAGFFLRTTTPGTPGTLRLTNANRVATFGPQPNFGRSAADRRPQLSLTLSSAAATLTDVTTLYAEAGATPGLDAAFDATKLANPSGLNLACVAATGEELAIDGRPAFTAATVVPLRLGAPTAGSYELTVARAQLPVGLSVYLRDAATGTQRQLAASGVVPLALPTGPTTRYSLVFAPATALGQASGLSAAQVALYPNPAARPGVTVVLPARADALVMAEVLNALGQVVLPARRLPVTAGQATGLLPTAGLAAGIYTVRLTTGTSAVSKRLVVK